jgi:ATP-dependent Lon protease
LTLGVLPMFPLGSVLFPSLALPLHVFEPRYRAMTRHLLSEGVEPEFGVVLIERGSEVGGDDVRRSIGSVARVREAAELPDGRWVLLALGTRRVRVVEWLPDDPWPRAIVEDLPDEPDGGGVEPAAWDGVRGSLRRVLGLAAELGEAAVAATIELADDPALGSFQAAAVAPLGPLDQYLVLECRSAAERVVLLGTLLEDQAELLEARLRLG